MNIQSNHRFFYNLAQTFSINLGGKKLVYQSKPGITNWQQVNPSIELIVSHVSADADDRILFFGCGHGAGPAAIALKSPGAEILCHDFNSIALEMANNTFNLNQLTNARILSDINLPDSEKGTYNKVIIDLPKGRRLAQRWLLQAWEAAKSGGILYLAGAKGQGIQSTLKDAQELWGLPAILDYKKGYRLARFIKNAISSDLPGWTVEPGNAQGTWYKLNLSINDHDYQLVSLPGIFSYDRLDKGTKILLESVTIEPKEHILDLGCGYGIIGVVAGFSGAEMVDFVDINLLGIAATQENILRFGLKNTSVFTGDAFEKVQDRYYDLILTNPPFHSGKAVDYNMAQAFIQQSYQQLVPSGRFILVANQFINYDKQMKEVFNKVSQLCKREGYQVLIGVK